MSNRPIIGISLDTQDADQFGRKGIVYELSAAYALAVEMAGGVPMLLHHTGDSALRDAYMRTINGLLIPGGNDLDSSLYGQAPHVTSRRLDPRRQAFDLAMLALAQSLNVPVLGICFGCQAMNVHRGGSLHQYIPDLPRNPTIVHAGNPANTTDKNAWHSVAVAPQSHLHAILNAAELKVNSRHRQAIDRLGASLRASAVSPDGLVEAIEDDSMKFWIGVQWHAEGLRDPPHPQLFQAFVAAAAE